MVAHLMTLTWGMLVGLCLAAGLAWFWHDSLGVRERANQAAMEACERLQLQFLDGTVAFARLWPARGFSGRLTLRRTYVFDYTADSIARRQGFVVLLGSRVETVGFENETPMAPAPAQPTPETRDNDRTPSWGNVYDLESWRRNSQRLESGHTDRGNGDA